MSPVHVLQEASRCGIRLEVDGVGVRYAAPRGSLTPALRKALTAHKTALRQLLSAPPADFQSEEPCAICASHERWHWLDGRVLCRVCVVLDLAPMTLEAVIA